MRHYTTERCPVCHRQAACSPLLFETHTTAHASQECSGSGKPTKLGQEVQQLMTCCTQLLVLVETTKGVKWKPEAEGGLAIEAWKDNWGVTWWEHLPCIEDLRRVVLASHKAHPELTPSGLVWAPAQEGAPVLAKGPTTEKRDERSEYDASQEVYCSDFCDAAGRCIMGGGCGRVTP